jgi:hypothetical protein
MPARQNRVPGQTIVWVLRAVLPGVQGSLTAGAEPAQTKNHPWEQLKGKTYPGTLDEQFKALRFDRQHVDNLHCDERWAYPRKKNWIFPPFSRQFVGSRVYPTRKDSRDISFFSRGGAAKVISMDIWQSK